MNLFHLIVYLQCEANQLKILHMLWFQGIATSTMETDVEENDFEQKQQKNKYKTSCKQYNLKQYLVLLQS